ncbi:hypothetical protein BC835DRAFT_1270191 [Cytidiella melzeri]|nr:hypothetical protein BC835DRAFT_1270191 [Cytidiella melzeri]
MSKPLRESSSNLESHTTTSHLTSEAGHTHVDPLPASVLLPNPTDPPLDSVTAISDAQIDPALLEAVVTVLQHVNQSEAQSSQPLGQQTLASSQSIIQESDLSSRPVPRKRRSKLGPGEAGPSKTSGSGAGSRKTTRYASKPEAEQAAERSEEDDGYPKQRKRTKRVSDSSGSTRKRRSRAPSVPAYDADADPGEELDPTAVTMADLCDDTGRGRVSSKAVQIMTNHTAWRAANREKRARMRMLMEAKKYGRGAEEEENAQAQDTNPTETPAEGQSGNQAIAGPPSPRAHSVEAGTTEGQQGDDFDYTQAMATSRYNVQVRIGPNGETIIDETSLFVDRQEEDETANYTHIEESDATKFVNSMTYSKKLRGSRWSAEETELFFDALSQFGENYELISYVLPGRDRKACKNKFKAEDKRNPNRVTYCLNNQRPYDMQTLARMTGKDFSGPPPEICAPTPLRMPHDTDTRQEGDSAPIQKEGATPAPDEAEVIGEVGILGEHEA